MPQRENVTKIDPTICRSGPLRRAEMVTVVMRAVPRSVSSPRPVTLTAEPVARPAGSVTGWARVKVAAGWLRTPSIFTSSGDVLCPTFTAVRSMRNVAEVTRRPEMTTVPVTALVRPTTSLLSPKTVSVTRNPAAEPAVTSQVPPAGLAGEPPAAAGRARAALAAWSQWSFPAVPNRRRDWLLRTGSTPQGARIGDYPEDGVAR
jgi:hypothetical protein